MGWIILLIILGMILFLAELVLLPGITIAAIGSFCALVAAVSLAYIDHGLFIGTVVLLIVLLLLSVCTALFLRPKTWNRFALKTKITEPISESIDIQTQVGATGMALTRLAPMGKVEINGKIYEAKSLDSYIDQKSRVVVTGFENSNIVVKLQS